MCHPCSALDASCWSTTPIPLPTTSHHGQHRAPIGALQLLPQRFNLVLRFSKGIFWCVGKMSVYSTQNSGDLLGCQVIIHPEKIWSKLRSWENTKIACLETCIAASWACLGSWLMTWESSKQIGRQKKKTSKWIKAKNVPKSLTTRIPLVRNSNCDHPIYPRGRFVLDVPGSMCVLQGIQRLLKVDICAADARDHDLRFQHLLANCS